jgi:predicted ester cyclase
MSDTAATVADSSIEGLIDSFRAQHLPRARLLAALTAAGASAAAAGMLVNLAEHSGPAQPMPASASSHHQLAGAVSSDMASAHDQHLSNQMAGAGAADARARSAAVANMMGDYSSNAVVNDPLFGGPLVGQAAIAVHKTAEMAAISDLSFSLLSRSIVGNQILATWELEGLHSGPYYSLPATGKRIRMQGATVQTRGQDGKILVETLYYDAAQMRRQLSQP